MLKSSVGARRLILYGGKHSSGFWRPLVFSPEFFNGKVSRLRYLPQQIQWLDYLQRAKTLPKLLALNGVSGVEIQQVFVPAHEVMGVNSAREIDILLILQSKTTRSFSCAVIPALSAVSPERLPS